MEGCLLKAVSVHMPLPVYELPSKDDIYFALVFRVTLNFSVLLYDKMTGGTPEVRSNKSLTLLTFAI